MQRGLLALDNTWRIIGRETKDGRERYVFARAGGDKPSYAYTIYSVPIETFWGKR